MEVGVICRALMRAKLWRKIQDDVKGFEERHDIIREVLTQKQKSKLFRIAASNPDMDSRLLRGSDRGHHPGATNRSVDQSVQRRESHRQYVRSGTVEDASRDRNHQTQPGSAYRVCANVGDPKYDGRAQTDNFIFSACENRILDYSKPQESVHTAWRALTKKAGLRFRMHDLRHQAITERNEAGVPESVIMSMCGHRKMMEHYTHIRTAAKTKAAAVLGGTGILLAKTAALRVGKGR